MLEESSLDNIVGSSAREGVRFGVDLKDLYHSVRMNSNIAYITEFKVSTCKTLIF